MHPEYFYLLLVLVGFLQENVCLLECLEKRLLIHEPFYHFTRVLPTLCAAVTLLLLKREDLRHSQFLENLSYILSIVHIDKHNVNIELVVLWGQQVLQLIHRHGFFLATHVFDVQMAIIVKHT